MNINVRKTIFVIINILLLLLQVTVFSNLKIGWININFAFISVIFTSLFTDDWLFAINGFLIGFWFDMLAYRGMGYYTLLFLCMAIAIKLFSKMINRYSFITGIVVVFAATFIEEFLTYWIHFILKGTEYNSFALTKLIMPQCLVNTVASIFLFWLYLWLIKALDIKNFRRL